MNHEWWKYRKRKAMPLAVCACALMAGCASSPDLEREIATGSNAAVSPDGKYVAYQVITGTVSRLAVKCLANNRETIVEDGPNSALHPTWAPDGTLVYSYCQTRATAYQKWIAPKTDKEKGWILRMWKDGVKSDLTQTGARDFLPAVSPDGKKVYFTSTSFKVDKTTNKGNLWWSGNLPQCLHVVELKPGSTAKRYLPPPAETESGHGQCAISPDGRYIAWAQISAFHDAWGIVASAIDTPQKSTPLLPKNMVGYGPNWAPDSRTLCFTGYLEGDEGWYVYLTDVVSGNLKRVCVGEDPCFTPDGKSVVYNRDGKVYMRALLASDWPSKEEKAGVESSGTNEETVLWKTQKPLRDAKLPLPKDLAFKEDETFFVRAKVKWTDSKEANQFFVTLAYDDSAKKEQAFQIYRPKDGRLAVATRTGADRFTWLQDGKHPLVKPGEYVLTAIKSNRMIYLSINDGMPVSQCLGQGVISFTKPLYALIGRSFGKTDSVVKSVEVGKGWPKNVPNCSQATRKEVFK